MSEPLSDQNLAKHMAQVIKERAELHLELIEIDEGEVEVTLTPIGAFSVWVSIQETIEEAGWRIVPK